jgi:hypothetical protein
MKCVGCGFCCVQQRCSFSLVRWPGHIFADCPGLEWTGKVYRCRAIRERMVIEIPGRGLVGAKKYLETGHGCLAPTEWRKDIRERSKNEVPGTVRQHVPSLQFRDLLLRQYGRI